MGVLVALMAIPSIVAASDGLERFPIAHGMIGWETREFSDETRYEARSGQVDAECSDAASALIFEREIDLRKTPVLRWSWKVDNVYKDLHEKTRSGDDYPARIYVIKERGLFGMSTLALNYVWSSTQTVGSEWESAYTDQAMMRAVDAGDTKAGTWRTHSRNVRRDFKRLFGEDIDEVDGIAIMTDCDDSGQSAKASYRDIFFGPET